MTARLSAEQRQALELLAREPRGVTGHLLVVAHGFEMKMLAGLAHEGLVAAVVGESTRQAARRSRLFAFGSLPQGGGRLKGDRLRRPRQPERGVKQTRFRRQRIVRCCEDRDLVTGAGGCGGGGSETLERMYCPMACSLVISPFICT
jgi:hypothetical protein